MVDKILPRVHGDVTSWVKKEIEAVAHFSFTTDAWSASAGNASLLSVTAHWLTENFVKKSAVLHVQPLVDSHTGEYLTEVYKKMLDRWGISHNQVYLLLSDDAANIGRLHFLLLGTSPVHYS